MANEWLGDGSDGVAARLVVGLGEGLAVGDVVGGLDDGSVRVGRMAGIVETLLWAQSELEVELELLRADRFADTRGLDAFLARVRDSLKAVQDGSGDPAGLVRTGVGVSVTSGREGEGAPRLEMGG